MASEKDEVMERVTDELMEQLLAAESPEAYLIEQHVREHVLSDYLNELLHKRGLKKAAVFKEAGMCDKQGYALFKGKGTPGRDNAIKLAFGLHCNLLETQRLLRLAGLSELWCKQPRDSVIIWCIQNGLSRVETDDELYAAGEKPLLDD